METIVNDNPAQPGDQCAKCHHTRAAHKKNLAVGDYVTKTACCVYCGPDYCPTFLDYATLLKGTAK